MERLCEEVLEGARFNTSSQATLFRLFRNCDIGLILGLGPFPWLVLGFPFDYFILLV